MKLPIRFARPVTRIVAPALLALSLMSAALPAAQSIQAAGPANIKINQCTIVNDTINWGDGVDWYRLEMKYTNNGGTATGAFKMNARPVWVPGQSNEAFYFETHASIAPGQVLNRTFWLTKKTVDQKTYGVFMDLGPGPSQVNEGGSLALERDDNFCSAFHKP